MSERNYIAELIEGGKVTREQISVAHAMRDEIFSLRAEIERLRAALATARNNALEEAAKLCEDFIEFDGAGLPAIQAINFSHQFKANQARRSAASAIRALKDKTPEKGSGDE